MKIELIKTQREYRAALRRVEELMDARPGSAQGDELELLAALIEIYEEEHALFRRQIRSRPYVFAWNRKT